MNYSTSVRLKNSWTVLHYFDIRIGPGCEITYLNTCQRYLGLEFSVKDYPLNGIVFDFFQAKQLLKKFLSKVNKKVLLCTRSSFYSLKITEDSVLVQIKGGDCYIFPDENCIILECNEIDDQVMTQKVSEYVQRKIVSCEVESVVYGNIFISDEEGRVQGMSFFEFGRD